VFSGLFDILVYTHVILQVSVSFSKATVEPDDNVNVTVTAYKDSYVGLSAVDQSVLLLKSGNDITQDLVRINALKIV
jgi:hypothetical protein